MSSSRTTGAVYLGTSAVFKLLVAEPETEALGRFLADWPLRVSSELLRVELLCSSHRRYLSTTEIKDLLAGLQLLPLTAMVLRRASEPFEPPQRALDALHLAAAEQAREQLDRFVSYDREQLAAAAALGWHTEQPT